MADVSISPRARLWARVDRVWLVILAIPLVLAVADASEVGPMLRATVGSIGHTAIFITFAVLSVAWLKATGAETLLARAFQGNELRMIVLAAAMGGLSPFCSCEVIPFIAALLAVGAPLSAVMAFWIASPLMDPAMFLITAGVLGTEFAVAKAVAAVSMGLLGGLTAMVFSRSPVFANPLKTQPKKSCCSCGPGLNGKPQWQFWSDDARRETFRDTAVSNGLFLLKWLTLAYMIEALMVRYVPAEAVASVLGGEGFQPILLGALVGAPAYLNGYAAVPLVDALMQQGMSDGAAMAFVLAGGVSCIPAALAVWALVKPRVFAAYIALAFVGSVAAGTIWNVIA